MIRDDGVQGTRAMNESELARQANISTAVLRKWRREGTGPRFIKLGRLVRYRVRDVEAWLEEHAVDQIPKASEHNTHIFGGKEECQ